MAKSTSRTSRHKWRRLRHKLLVRAVRKGEFKCASCGVELDPKAPPNTALAGELDHVVPVAVAPEREFDETNLVWKCHYHNRSKGGRIERPRIPTTRKW